MSQLAKETDRMGGDQFHIIRGPLTFSEAHLSISVASGGVKEGTFTVYGPGGVGVDGFVTSSRSRMTVLTTSFAGSADEVAWRFDAAHMAAGETCEGYFRIVSNQGEYRLPFTVTAAAPVVTEDGTQITDLIRFTNLAKTDWQAAVRVFYSDGFAGIFSKSAKGNTGADLSGGEPKNGAAAELAGSAGEHDPSAVTRDDYELFRGLSRVKGNEHNVEEFLISTQRKAPVEYIPELTRIRTKLPYGSDGSPVEYYFHLSRNGWGYTHLRISAEGDFIRPAGTFLTGADYADTNDAEIHYFIDPDKLHAGRNFGSIRVRGAWCDLTIPVEVTGAADPDPSVLSHRREVSKITMQLTCDFIDYRAERIRGREWLSRAGKRIDRLNILEPGNPAGSLYKVHLLISEGRRREAAWTLAQFDSDMEEQFGIRAYSDPEHRLLEQHDPELYAYRVYLGVLCAENDERLSGFDAAAKIEEEHRKYPDSWRIAWILMYLSEDYRKRPSLKWELIREETARGANSPVLFIEAWRLVTMNPSILTELGDFETRLLTFAMKEELLTEEVIGQVNILMSRVKEYSARLLRILIAGYTLKGLRADTLRSICTLLLRGNQATKEAFPWYAKGVGEELPLTRLFEYYMLSMPEDYTGEIPQVVLRYFCYQSTLPYDRSARLYAYIIQHRMQNAELYERSLPQVRQFAAEQLALGRVSESLCYLYGYVLDNEMLTPENAGKAADAIFTCRVTCTHEGANLLRETEEEAGYAAARVVPDPTDLSAGQPKNDFRLVLAYTQAAGETEFPLPGDSCELPLYGSDYRLYLEDRDGNRFAASAKISVTRYVTRSDEFASMLSARETGSIPFALYLAGLPGDSFRVGPSNAARFRALSESPEVRDTYRARIREKLLDYYESYRSDREMREYLVNLPEDGVSADERSRILRCMAAAGLPDEALARIRSYGTENIDADVMKEVLSTVLTKAVEAGGSSESLNVDAVKGAGADAAGSADADEAGGRNGRSLTDADTNINATPSGTAEDRSGMPEEDPDPELTGITYEVFAEGAFDETMLRHLLRYYEGLTVEMDEIRQAAKKADLPVMEIVPRMVRQMLYSGAIMEDEEEIIAEFEKCGADTAVLTAVLAQVSHYYFADDVAFGDGVFRRIGELGEACEPLYDICRMAFLRHLSQETGELKTADLEIAKLFLGDLLEQGIVFPFYRRFAGLLPALARLSDETMIQYKGRPNADVQLHYSVDREATEGGSGARMTEVPMREMYDGIYVSGFILFFGERLRYFITDDAGRRNVVESGTCGQDTRISDVGEDRFAMINRISMYTAMGRYEDAMKAMEAYNRKAHLVETIFRRTETGRNGAGTDAV